MADMNYVRNYFSDQAAQWVRSAYEQGGVYPVGAHRMRVALEALIGRLGTTDTQLLDLGCGGGELAIHAAQLGFNAVGVDLAEGMIDECNKKRQTLPFEIQNRLRFICADAVRNQLPAGAFQAVAAMGLIEYLPNDDAFFKEVARLLKSGGFLAVSCRNRLFNLASFNPYTQREIKDRAADALIAELIEHTREPIPHDSLRRFLQKLKDLLPQLEQALSTDHESGGVTKAVSAFGQTRRQHTPHELAQAARRHGLTGETFFGIHPHPLPPKFETHSPRFYNQFAAAYEVFEAHPISLIWSSAFIAVFQKP